MADDPRQAATTLAGQRQLRPSDGHLQPTYGQVPHGFEQPPQVSWQASQVSAQPKQGLGPAPQAELWSVARPILPVDQLRARAVRMPTAGAAAQAEHGQHCLRRSIPGASATIDGPGLPPGGSAAEGRRGVIDGPGLPPGGSAAEGRRGVIDDRGLPPGGRAAEGRRGVIDDR